ncbi:S46 family peptidase [Halosquirtibacter xylanolyticus]|uniref:S46 family peptidase n=1 Tax=Halosquirtibacter xylanolyticus TaxID=3374599 RepID=UPI003749F9E8|nr:S46 family peptidase [Prolixibacteraceae bacterium]
MTKKIILFFCFINITFNAIGDEGMWIPAQLKSDVLQKMTSMGLHLSGEQIYRVGEKSLNDAIVGLGTKRNPLGFSATGSFIGDRGLVLTNHHCAVSYLQKHSSITKNYLKEGFYAKTPNEELPAEGLTLSRLVRMEDVTSRILSGCDTLSHNAIQKLIQKRGKEMVAQANENGRYRSVIKPYFSGAQYYLEVYQVYSDVRIVAMPPVSIGKFGGEKDNWNWPRNSADFCILRVYGENENSSQNYSVNNQPIVSPNYIHLSEGGVDEGDFTMVYGFPANTKKFLTAKAIDQLVHITNHHAVAIRKAKVSVLEKKMAEKSTTWLKYQSYYSQMSNKLLRWQGEIYGIDQYDLVAMKRDFEDRYEKWVNASEIRKSKYGKVLPSIRYYCGQLDSLEKVNTYVMEAGIGSANLISFVAKFDMLNAICSRKSVNQKRLDKELVRLKKIVADFYDSYELEVEKELLSSSLILFSQNVGVDNKPLSLVKAEAEYKGQINKYVKHLMKKSLFTNEKKINNFIKHYQKEDVEKLQKDPLFDLSINFYLLNRDKVYGQRVKIRRKYGKYHRLYVQSIKEMFQNKPLAPDANRSLRIAFGKVKGYNLHHVAYDYKSTIRTLFDKYKSDSLNYSLPDTFVENISSNDYDIPTCFITDVHTTGGNSGSPVLNSNGELVGLNFDRVKTGVVSDYQYLPELSRQISVDVRYIRYVLKSYLNAEPLLEEWK